jgi:hypothetical protein
LVTFLHPDSSVRQPVGDGDDSRGGAEGAEQDPQCQRIKTSRSEGNLTPDNF